MVSPPVFRWCACASSQLKIALRGLRGLLFPNEKVCLPEKENDQHIFFGIRIVIVQYFRNDDDTNNSYTITVSLGQCFFQCAKNNIADVAI